MIIGLLGGEYDRCLGLLKRQIEDLGHKAITINLKSLPQVTTATIDYQGIVYDGYNLFEMGSFYLREMEIRAPFFHVTYTKQLWAMLRERYLSFEAEERENILFTRNLLEILAYKKPMVNPPQVYSHRRQLPFHLSLLAQRGFSVPPFISGVEEDLEVTGFQEELPLNLDEERIWDVLSFPKEGKGEVRIWRKKPEGTTYKGIVLGESLLEVTVEIPGDGGAPRKVESQELPEEIRGGILEAAKAMGAAFAEVQLLYTAKEKRVWFLQVDPSPNFFELEKAHGLPISESLARYLVEIAD